jgi:hypothetical protein
MLAPANLNELTTKGNLIAVAASRLEKADGNSSIHGQIAESTVKQQSCDFVCNSFHHALTSMPVKWRHQTVSLSIEGDGLRQKASQPSVADPEVADRGGLCRARGA